MTDINRAVQYFSDEQLATSLAMSVEERLRFLDDFRLLHGAPTLGGKSKLISLKVPEALLDTFRRKCELEGVRYQTRIKELMLASLKGDRGAR